MGSSSYREGFRQGMIFCLHRAPRFIHARDSVWKAARDAPRDRLSAVYAASSLQVAWKVELWLNGPWTCFMAGPGGSSVEQDVNVLG